ncbi:MAG TPA: orotidine-5'-phosphate decarboxylase [Bryobacteraceae bacterium]|nr:orotidine-5'-phosphate decarboxylase [Bryobacteraceae bacterium]
MQIPNIDARERLIVALDLPTVEQARRMVESLGDAVTFYKVGLALQLAPGTGELISDLIRAGKRVFLDYKYYDISETLRKAVSRAATLGVSFLTVHGPSALIRSAVEAKGQSELKLFTVTVLTSMDTDDMKEMGYTQHSVEDLVLFRAGKALEAGCDGVIASGLEAKSIKALSHGKLLVVTPGIRDEESPKDDQKRRTTAAGAILAGADYLVIGRPITENPNPRVEAERTLGRMQAAFDELSGVAPRRTSGLV